MLGYGTSNRNLSIVIVNKYVFICVKYSKHSMQLTRLLLQQIDAFYWQLLRQLLKIHYANIVKNTDIYAKTTQHLWNYKINQNKFGYTGHILRLLEGTPDRQALKIAL